ncbi:MAG: metal-dependent hydrolase [Promethearchaeota archaeon]
MTSFITHIGIGIIFAEIIMRLIDNNPEFKKSKRNLFWWVGGLGGVAPDLDVVPALILGVHSYTFHHYYTHTFLAVGILLFILVVITKSNPLMLVFFIGYIFHLSVDFIDNSISPLGPFDILFLGKYIEWGLLTGGFQEMPCINGICGWESQFWLEKEYADHDLWSFFLHNGWGIPIGFEFLTYYDLVLMAVSIPLILYLFYSSIRDKVKNRF